MFNKLEYYLNKLRQEKPLILSLTNYVTIEFVANSLLSIGAAPVMSECSDEIEELLKMSSALYINIGTLDNNFSKRAKFACEVAKEYKIPIILDPVGVGASKVRRNLVAELLPFIDIIRGNASEIIATNGAISESLGVESVHQVSDAYEAARSLALELNITVMVSGKHDFITNGENEQRISFGSNLMQVITGAGCSLTAVISAFRAINSNSYEAVVCAASYFNLAGQFAEEKASAPGSFKNILIDNLYRPNWKRIEVLYGRK